MLVEDHAQQELNVVKVFTSSMNGTEKPLQRELESTICIQLTRPLECLIPHCDMSARCRTRTMRRLAVIVNDACAWDSRGPYSKARGDEQAQSKLLG